MVVLFICFLRVKILQGFFKILFGTRPSKYIIVISVARLVNQSAKNVSILNSKIVTGLSCSKFIFSVPQR